MAKGYTTCFVVILALVLILFLYVSRSYETGSPVAATTEVLTRLDNMQSVGGKVSARVNGGRRDKVTTSSKTGSKKGSSSLPSSGDITRVLTFEVFGKVQRVSMRKYAKEAAIKFKIKRWIKNTEAKTVKGWHTVLLGQFNSTKSGSPQKVRLDRSLKIRILKSEK